MCGAVAIGMRRHGGVAVVAVVVLAVFVLAVDGVCVCVVSPAVPEGHTGGCALRADTATASVSHRWRWQQTP